MAAKTLFSIEGTISVEYLPAERALIGHWESLCSPRFREALEKAMAEAARVGAVSWIVDLTKDPGVPSQADLGWIESKAVGLAKRSGIRAIINAHGKSIVSKMGSKRWSKSASDGGLSTYDCESVADAIACAADVASGKAA